MVLLAFYKLFLNDVLYCIHYFLFIKYTYFLLLLFKDAAYKCALHVIIKLYWIVESVIRVAAEVGSQTDRAPQWLEEEDSCDVHG